MHKSKILRSSVTTCLKSDSVHLNNNAVQKVILFYLSKPRGIFDFVGCTEKAWWSRGRGQQQSGTKVGGEQRGVT